MNAYKVDIWRSVYSNGKFSHNVMREKIVHARNKTEAEAKMILEPEHEYPTSKIKVSKEYIYSCRKIGTVHKETVTYFVYSDGTRIDDNKFSHGVLK